MDLADRLGAAMTPGPATGRVAQRALMARAGAVLFLAGGLLGVVSLVAPNSQVTSEGLYWGMSAGALAVAALLWHAGHRLPGWFFQAALAFGTLIVTASIHFTEETRTDNEILYLWTSLYAFFFFTRIQAALQLALMGACYGAVLAAEADATAGGQVTRWLVTMSALVVVGVLVRLLNKRVGQLIARLASAARTDALTGALNRRGFEELIASELERSRRTGRGLSLLAGDLDHFKQVNDRFGHTQGDRVLRRVADVLTSSKRRIDTLARIGGEEFAVLLPETDEHGAYVLAERLRGAVEREFATREEALTISFGVATFPQHGDARDRLLAAADRALYAAKSLGRNRSVIFSPQVDDLLQEGAAPGPATDIHLGTLVTLAEALDLRDSGTAQHSQAVGRYAALVGAELGLDPQRVERLRLAGVLHDIGKIGVSDTILRKPGRLTEAEWDEVRRHPEVGARLVGRASADIRDWVLSHHERPDGNGYPSGLRGEAIPLESRILAVADAYEAMTARRPYSEPMPPGAARDELRRCAGSQFDAEVVAALEAALDRDRAASAQARPDGAG